MKKKLAAIALAAVTSGISGVAASPTAATDYHRPSAEATYQVEITNITSGQYLTPPNFAAHSRTADVFQRGRKVSPGVQAVAENGGVPVLAAELAESIDAKNLGVSGVGGDAPIGPGEKTTFEFTTSENRLSVVSMIICTNDGFGGLDSKRLPRRDGQTKTYRLRDYDAGTEKNTELRADLVPAPFCGDGEGTDQSNPELAENGKIKRHRTLQGVGDLNPELDWNRGHVAEVKVTRVAAEATYTVKVENISTGQYLTPPNFAAHDRRVDVFRRGRPVSNGLQQLAENGAVPVFADELRAAVDDKNLGVSGVGGDAPLGPGESTTFDITSNESRVTIASMIICTNDGLAGLDSKRLPRWPGDSRTFYGRSYDAGTEKNTELRADIVPAPFCGDGEGTDQSDPELAENSVLRRHRTLGGVGDLDPSLDWRGPIMKVTITKK